MSSGYDVLIAGGGIVGLATARALLMERSSLRVAVVEKEPEVGRHQTGHNSGVLHSGIYYRPGSLKAVLCLAGKHEIEAFAAAHGLPVAYPGKLIVATEQSELPRLDELRRRGVENGARDLRELTSREIAEIEPNAAGLRALHSPTTGAIDYSLVARALADELRGMGCDVLLGQEITALRVTGRRVTAASTSGEISAGCLIGCAGLQSDRLARLGGAEADARIVPFRGDYYLLTERAAQLVQGHVYPVPDPAFPFLGAHLTRRIDGSVLCGPNAALALAREQYRRLGFDSRDARSVLGYPGVRRFGRRHVREAAGELWRAASKRAFVAALRRYVPALRQSDLLPGPTGIRAQAMTRRGDLLDDFLIAGSPRMMHVLNAPSPGATASFAIGTEIARRAFHDLIG